MPLYEYKCKKCNKEFEVLIFNLSEKVKCQHCGSKSVKRLLSTFGIGGKESSQGNSGGSSCSSSSCSGCTGCH